MANDQQNLTVKSSGMVSDFRIGGQEITEYAVAGYFKGQLKEIEQKDRGEIQRVINAVSKF